MQASKRDFKGGRERTETRVVVLFCFVVVVAVEMKNMDINNKKYGSNVVYQPFGTFFC